MQPEQNPVFLLGLGYSKFIHYVCPSWELQILSDPCNLLTFGSNCLASVLHPSNNWSKSVQRGLEHCRTEPLLLSTELKSEQASKCPSSLPLIHVFLYLLIIIYGARLEGKKKKKCVV
ncbi:hypothetical protein I3843_05G113400 [Carya illinoinensis]|nr:hypothetical protein I3843_05G113400 [Carya illinoinensis]